MPQTTRPPASASPNSASIRRCDGVPLKTSSSGSSTRSRFVGPSVACTMVRSCVKMRWLPATILPCASIATS
ncbi:MAG: hypothetical protein ACK56F_10830 [bacterium]